MEELKEEYYKFYGRFTNKNFIRSDYDNLKLEKNIIDIRVYVRNLYRENNLNDYLNFKNKIIDLYHKEEYGLKLISRFLGCSYTNTRNLFQFLGIEVRKGRQVVTNRVRLFRKDKAINESRNKIGWSSYESISKNKTTKTSRGIQGYYYNESKSKYQWLRSSWEYIFAKWCNKHKLNWSVEDVTFKISNGTSYRPDFFIYDDNWELKTIVEIKGYWDDKLYKFLEISNIIDEYGFVLIRSKEIPNYTDNFNRDCKFWKENRILKI